MLGESQAYGINGSYGESGKKLSINFSKVMAKVCLRLCYNVDNSYLFVNGN